MRIIVATILLLIITSAETEAQPNCMVYDEESDCRKACEQYLKSEKMYEGLINFHKLMDSVILQCPSFSHAYRQKSDAYLQNGEFLKWREWIDQAVELNSSEYLRIRAWNRFRFLRDYTGTLSDLALLQAASGTVGYSLDGNYDMRIIGALCLREIGNIEAAIDSFNNYLYKKENNLEKHSIGTFDYLYSGITKLEAGLLNEAKIDFRKQIEYYKQLPESYYYLGLIHYQNEEMDLAKENLTIARDYLLKGYHMPDGYTECLDRIYLGTVDELLLKIHP